MNYRLHLERALRVIFGAICLLTVALFPIFIPIILLELESLGLISLQFNTDLISTPAVRMTTLLIYAVFFTYFLRFLYWIKEVGVKLWNMHTFPFDDYELERPEYDQQNKIEECKKHARKQLLVFTRMIPITLAIFTLAAAVSNFFNSNPSQEEIANYFPDIIIEVTGKLPVIGQFITFFDFLPSYGPVWTTLFLIYCLPLTAAMRNYAFIFENADYLRRGTRKQRVKNAPYVFTIFVSIALTGIISIIFLTQF